MALRDQPYIPLYIQDLMTDEKLNNCCAATHGIYIKGLMCLMHKSEEYGKILLQQKFKQTDKQSKNFAIMLVKHLPYTIDEIEKAIDELIEEKVCYFEDDFICQKRMIKDGALSKVRSKVGKLGGNKTKENNEKLLKNLPKQNMQQITEYENEYESEIIITNSSNNTNGEISKKIEPLTFAQCIEKMKSDEKLKEDQVFVNKISLSDYSEYLEIFARTRMPINERERIDYTDKRQYFINWVGTYKSTFEKNRGIENKKQQNNNRPKIKIL